MQVPKLTTLWRESVVVAAKGGAYQARAEELARKLGVALLDKPLPAKVRRGQWHCYCPAPFILLVDEAGLALQHTLERDAGPLRVDYTSGPLGYRATRGGFSKEALVRAVGLRPGANGYVLDATAGLGRDAFILAAYGIRVLMVERHPLMATLVADALLRAERVSRARDSCARITLRCADSRQVMAECSAQTGPETVYLDPMFESAGQRAAVKKDMQLLRLLAADEDQGALFESALACAAKRVVVKRALHASSVTLRKPDIQLKGRSTRFDVYLCPNAAKI